MGQEVQNSLKLCHFQWLYRGTMEDTVKELCVL